LIPDCRLCFERFCVFLFGFQNHLGLDTCWIHCCTFCTYDFDIFCGQTDTHPSIISNCCFWYQNNDLCFLPFTTAAAAASSLVASYNIFPFVIVVVPFTSPAFLYPVPIQFVFAFWFPSCFFPRLPFVFLLACLWKMSVTPASTWTTIR